MVRVRSVTVPLLRKVAALLAHRALEPYVSRKGARALIEHALTVLDRSKACDFHAGRTLWAADKHER